MAWARPTGHGGDAMNAADTKNTQPKPAKELPPTLREACDRVELGLNELARLLSLRLDQEISVSTIQHYWENKHKSSHLPRDKSWSDALYSTLMEKHLPPDYVNRLFGIERDKDLAAIRDELSQLRQSIARLETVMTTLVDRLSPPDPN